MGVSVTPAADAHEHSGAQDQSVVAGKPKEHHAEADSHRSAEYHGTAAVAWSQSAGGQGTAHPDRCGQG